ncbi:MAG: hypothetical protein LLG06_10155 [Desulfobacteraceae bacterium]|nr:hypothetical protein [Desulfobacteraceae bacterium]
MNTLAARVAAAAVFVFVILSGAVSGAHDSPLVTKEELKAEMGRPGAPTVIDVRLPGEWQNTQWKIAGAVWRDPTKVSQWKDQYSPGDNLVLYCA